MTRATSIGILSLLILAPAAGSQTIFAGKKGAELRARVRQEYTPNNPLNYNAARAVLFGTVENNGGKSTKRTVNVTVTKPIPTCSGITTSTAYETAKTVAIDCSGAVSGDTVAIVDAASHGTATVVSGDLRDAPAPPDCGVCTLCPLPPVTTTTATITVTPTQPARAQTTQRGR